MDVMPTLPRNTTTRPWMKERKAHERRNSPNRELYNSATWRNLAKAHKAQNPFCAMCETGVAEVTDHIKPVNEGGSMFGWNNLQSLCKACHAKKSGKEAHAR